jgi:hypothetical protein
MRLISFVARPRCPTLSLRCLAAISLLPCPLVTKNIKNLRARLLVVSVALFCTQAQSQTLVYSLSYVETRASFRAHFANVSPFPGRRSEQENLAMLRNSRKTEIYSVSITDGRRALLFSDEGLNLEIKAAGAVCGSGIACIEAIWREWRSSPVPGPYSETAVYEIRLDGSKQFRRILDARANQAPALLNAQGTKAVVETFDKGNFVVSIYTLPEWKPLHTFELTKLIQAHCPLCTPLSYGWLADGNRIFFELGLVGDDDEEDSKSNVPGTYLVSEDGTDIGSISSEVGALQLDGYIHAKSVERQFIGQLPDGSYLFEDYAVPSGKLSQLQAFLVIAKPGSKPQRTFPLKFAIRDGFLSSSGNYLAYIEDRETPNYRTERHLWVKDLRSGEEKELFAVPPKSPASDEPDVTISVLGWGQ